MVLSVQAQDQILHEPKTKQVSKIYLLKLVTQIYLLILVIDHLHKTGTKFFEINVKHSFMLISPQRGASSEQDCILPGRLATQCNQVIVER